MADYHTTYEGLEGQTTQWEDIQVKLGNMAPRPKPEKPAAWEPEPTVVKGQAWVQQQDQQALSEDEDSFKDDRDLENLRCATAYRIHAWSVHPKLPIGQAVAHALACNIECNMPPMLCLKIFHNACAMRARALPRCALLMVSSHEKHALQTPVSSRKYHRAC